MDQRARRQRVGVFGGTFDPIHVGHLLVAQYAAEGLKLDRLILIPAAQSPLKPGHKGAAAKERLEMVRLAVSGNPLFEVDDREIRRGGTSYTVETLRELAAELSDSDLFFIMGADSLAQLDSWREPEAICELAHVAVLHRGGSPEPDREMLQRYLPADRKDQVDEHILTMPQIELSSSSIRQRVLNNQPLRYMVHPTTSAYISAANLYQGSS